MRSTVLAVDVGTTKLKMAVVRDAQEILAEAEQAYPIQTREGGQRDSDTQLWWEAFLGGCHHVKPFLGDVQALCFSVSTPGATALDRQGHALTPAVLFLDGRSRKQAQYIRERIGEEVLLEHTSNLPVSGGCTASTLLWWREHQPHIYQEAAMFGHTNTLFGKRLTGHWGMDPSTASLTALYNTTRNDGSWNTEILEALEIPIEKLPPIIPSWEPVGGLLPEWAAQTGLPPGIPVLMGGNDAMCAALNGGVDHEGAILDICGTCEILAVGLARSIPGRHYNVRCHVIPNLWSTLYVLNTGGKALEWCHAIFYREMEEDIFYNHYIPQAIDHYFDSGINWELPDYDVYLAGDRYSTEDRRASFHRFTLETQRDHFLLSILRGNNQYMARHLQEMRNHIPLSPMIHLTGGGLSHAMIRCKQYWMGDYEYTLQKNSSLMGAAQLAHYYITNQKTWDSTIEGIK